MCKVGVQTEIGTLAGDGGAADEQVERAKAMPREGLALYCTTDRQRDQVVEVSLFIFRFVYHHH